VKNLLKRKNTLFIMGRPKRACKSWTILNMIWQLSEGKPLWGIERVREGPLLVPPRPMRCVYFSQEDTIDDLNDRISLLKGAGWKTNKNVYFVPKNLRMGFDETGLMLMMNELNIAAQDGPIDFIAFDPMRRMYRGSENDSEVISGIWRSLDIIHERFNCSTAFSHHIVKPPRDTNSNFDETSPYAGRGSGDIYGGGDAFINIIQRHQQGRPKTSRLLDFHFESKRSGDMSPVTLSVNFQTGEISFVGFCEGRGAKRKQQGTDDLLEEIRNQ
jgi:RecA-family ATPase